MWGFLKSTDSIVGNGATVVLPDVDANMFHHEAELVVVFGKAGDHIPGQCRYAATARVPCRSGHPKSSH
jgi:2-keto-4-pentenoate hydratase/2-oxohepta-3-ene-1,7-dioic acid hydratase in catechol pathway